MAVLSTGVFVDYVLVVCGVSGTVVDVPSECLEEGIDELAPDLRFVVRLLLVGRLVLGEALHELEDAPWRWGGFGLAHSGHGTMIGRVPRLGEQG